jgi:hypothetical protein
MLEISLQIVQQLLQMLVKQRCAAMNSTRGEKTNAIDNFRI